MRYAAMLALIGALSLGSTGTAYAYGTPPTPPVSHKPPTVPTHHHWVKCPGDPRLMMACFRR